MLNIVTEVPEGLLQAETGELLDVLGAPTLIHLQGRRKEPLFVSVLLHGNEDTGFYTVREVLRKYAGQELPRSLSIYIGNVYAARENVRRLDDQPDYNRIWPGALDAGLPEHAMMQQVVDEMAARKVFAAIDIHNNTGINPHYACINTIDHGFLHLATLFSRTVVYFTRPRGVASMAFARLCPSVTVESGKPGHPYGVEHAASFVEAALNLSDIPQHPVVPQDVDLFHTIAIIKVPEALSFGFNETGCDLCFLDDLDHLNFMELPKGSLLGRAQHEQARLEAWDERGRDIGDRYFAVDDGEIRTLRPLMPSMFTLNEKVIRQDCLGYLMERYPLEQHLG